eukprot:SAG11_NODE_14223_length_620_cov_2.723608_2_plen_59_part_01
MVRFDDEKVDNVVSDLAPQFEKLTHEEQKDLKTKQEEIEMEQPILVEQDIGVLQLIKKV